MKPLNLDAVTQFVNENITGFHEKRLAKIQELNLRDVLRRKNPYLFRAKHIQSASELVSSLVDATLSSSEETLFGTFLEEVAIFINQLVFDGQKATTKGIDLDFRREGVRYLVAIKSGPNWGNSSQYQALEANFKTALKVVRQSQHSGEVRAVLGMCYGHRIPSDRGTYESKEGQAFWEFVSGSTTLYQDLIEPLGYEARAHNDRYLHEKNALLNRLAGAFITDFCEPDGSINWGKLLAFNSGNLPI